MKALNERGDCHKDKGRFISVAGFAIRLSVRTDRKNLQLTEEVLKNESVP